jgi:DNA-binding response OmpR family regulator
MGIISYAVTPAQAFNEIDNRYTAILLTGMENASFDEEFVISLKSLSLGATVIAICNNAAEYLAKNPKFSAIDKYFDDSISSAALVDEIEALQRERLIPRLSAYTLSGIDLSARNPKALYLCDDIGLSKTETMILRFLICRHPLPVDTSDVLKYAFKPGKSPEASNVRTHICAINKKFKAITGKHLIEHERGAGYTINPPINVRMSIDIS